MTDMDEKSVSPFPPTSSHINTNNTTTNNSSSNSNKAAVTAEEMKLINEEYKVWKKNTPFLYDLCMIHSLEWPSLTVQWLPDTDNSNNSDMPTSNSSNTAEINNNNNVNSSSSSNHITNKSIESDITSCPRECQRLLLGTNASDYEPNFLLICEVRLPNINDNESETQNGTADETAKYGQYGRLEVIQAISHPTEVNRARYCPHQPSLIATKSAGAEVLIFDRTLHPAKPAKYGSSAPDLRLLGHTKEGYGLTWHPILEGVLASGSKDSLICVWDVLSGQPNARATLIGHNDAVEDICWQPGNFEVLASVSDDRKLMVWDLRTGASPVQVADAHNAEINAIHFNPFVPNLLLTGCADGTIGLFDARNISSKLHSFEAHTDQVFSVQWHSTSEVHFASGSSDRRVCVWDISRIGEDITAEDSEDGPPELIFWHGGHTDKIADICWGLPGPFEWTCASVADDSIIQLWQMSRAIYEDESEDSVPEAMLE